MDATVSVLHGIPEGAGADVVDVYAGDAMLIDNLTPGSLETLVVPGGHPTISLSTPMVRAQTEARQCWKLPVSRSPVAPMRP